MTGTFVVVATAAAAAAAAVVKCSCCYYCCHMAETIVVSTSEQNEKRRKMASEEEHPVCPVCCNNGKNQLAHTHTCTTGLAHMLGHERNAFTHTLANEHDLLSAAGFRFSPEHRRFSSRIERQQMMLAVHRAVICIKLVHVRSQDKLGWKAETVQMNLFPNFIAFTGYTANGASQLMKWKHLLPVFSLCLFFTYCDAMKVQIHLAHITCKRLLSENHPFKLPNCLIYA